MTNKRPHLGLVAPASRFPIDEFHKAATHFSPDMTLSYPDEIFDFWRHFSGSDEVRAQLLMSALLDSQVDAVWAVRGGYGCHRLLPYLELDKLRDCFKPILGFSDLTVLNLFFYRQLGWPSFQAPMLLSAMQSSRDTWVDALRMILQPAGQVVDIFSDEQTRIVQEGAASGRMMGGNLSLLCHSMGTNYEVDLNDAIFYFEEVNESSYKIDRMLRQLEACGKFETLKAVIVGDLLNCNPITTESPSAHEFVCEIFSKYRIPIVWNFPYGHGSRNRVMPFSHHATLRASSSSVSLSYRL